MASSPSGGFEFNRPTIISLLYICGLVTGITGLVGIVLAYVWRNEAHEAWEATHYTYLIRTFWIALAASVVGVITAIIGIGILLMIAVTVWVVVRSILSLLNAQKRIAMPDPQTFLI
jgi:uncharacterized membrane protein